jgi:hypothetical protein
VLKGESREEGGGRRYLSCSRQMAAKGTCRLSRKPKRTNDSRHSHPAHSPSLLSTGWPQRDQCTLILGQRFDCRTRGGRSILAIVGLGPRDLSMVLSQSMKPSVHRLYCLYLVANSICRDFFARAFALGPRNLLSSFCYPLLFNHASTSWFILSGPHEPFTWSWGCWLCFSTSHLYYFLSGSKEKKRRSGRERLKARYKKK